MEANDLLSKRVIKISLVEKKETKKEKVAQQASDVPR